MSAVVVAVVAATTLAACGSDTESDAARATSGFAAAIGRQDVKAAAELTSAPAQAQDTLDATFSGMGAQSVSTTVAPPVEYSDGTASFSMTTTWKWSDNTTFETETSGTARRLSSGWKVQWDPELLQRGMTADARLQRVRTEAKPAPKVISRSGKTFMSMEPVNEITFDAAAAGRKKQTSIAALAASIKPIAPLITARTITDAVERTPGQPIVAVTLRDSDMKVLASDPERIEGVTVTRSGRLVMDDRRLSSPLEAGLANYWTAISDATAGWQVQLAVPGAKPQRLAGKQGRPGPDVKTSIDQNQQLILGDSVVEVAQPATMMVLDANSGGILGLAQNDAAAKRGVQAGLDYPVGSTLTPLYGAVDRSLPGSSNSDPAARERLQRFGIGLRFTAPGVSLPSDKTGPTVSTAGFSPDDVKASLLSMGALGVALARSSDGKDSGVAPYVISGAPTKIDDGELGPFDKVIARDTLRSMTKIARSGDASDLTGAPGLKALVGTNGPQGPGWFLGLIGSKVLVVYCEGDRSGTAALQVAQKYFRVSDR